VRLTAGAVRDGFVVGDTWRLPLPDARPLRIVDVGVQQGASGDDLVRIRVADDGAGIPAELQKRIFEPFFSARRGGTGLGLFLSLDFVRHWGGDIEVRSTPGAGSTFEVVLPAAARARPLRVVVP